MPSKSRTRRIIEGGVYNVLLAEYCTDHNIESDITKSARGHMVLVLGRKQGHPHCWRIATITTKIRNLFTPGDEFDNFLPFAPISNKKKRYPMQLQLIQEAPGLFLQFWFPSYLRIDREYYIHAEGLEEVVSAGSGVHWRLAKKGTGSFAQLTACLQKRGRERSVVEAEAVEATEEQ